MLYISLGGNCSITYHLIENNLRKKAYPFDWSKISIKQLINILIHLTFNFICSKSISIIKMFICSIKHDRKNYCN